MNDDFAAIIQQDIFVDRAVVFDRQVVAERELDPVKQSYVLADVLEERANIARTLYPSQ